VVFRKPRVNWPRGCAVAAFINVRAVIGIAVMSFGRVTYIPERLVVDLQMGLNIHLRTAVHI